MENFVNSTIAKEPPDLETTDSEASESFHRDSYEASNESDASDISFTSSNQSLSPEVEDVLEGPQYEEKQGITFESVKERQLTKMRVGFTVQGLYTKCYPTAEEKQRKPERETIVCRQRIKTRPIESSDPSESLGTEDDQNQDYETAMFEPGTGLVDGWFWHEYDPTIKVVREDRAILFQSQENYQEIMKIPAFASCFEGVDFMETPTFGEQVIVNGCDISQIAIGDIFEVEGGLSTLTIEITAPRKPCNYMNKKHGTKCGVEGIQSFTHHNVLAGWFARVLIEGELRDGMKLIRKTHPHPKWTLPAVFKALYGEGSSLSKKMCTATWNRSRKELEELINLPQLGEYEWKAEARRLLLKKDGINVQAVSPDLIDPQIDPAKVYQPGSNSPHAVQIVSDTARTSTITATKESLILSWAQVLQMLVLFSSMCILFSTFLEIGV